MTAKTALLRKFSIEHNKGFTLVELAMIIVVLGIIAAVAIPRFGDMDQSARINATKAEMQRLKKAIIGNPEVVAGGQYVNRGFEGDVGFVPQSLSDLAAKPDSVPTFDKFARIGWNGPYIDSSGQEYLKDAWGNSYGYNPAARTITSNSISPPITVTF